MRRSPAMNVVQRLLDLPEPEYSEAALRAAHEHLKIPRPFNAWMSMPWGPPLLRCGARVLARRAARSR